MNNIVIQNYKIYQELKSYFLGFIFSLILTIIPFSVVFKRFFNIHITFFIVIMCAVIQCLVHVKYFLHLSFSVEHVWNITFLIFTILVIFIIIFGSIWIMHNLNHHFIYHNHNIV
ncbi:Cytochrome bo(3) ubiquinol oxidase subunit 4 [Buchnera aphidicola (Takecallis arundicolens)]|uniref:cytochrome o ubiquinol oxidase subunit IV n=1 Tax=Buchnera aphidicola TaxID=9 RepID=UPI00346456A7